MQTHAGPVFPTRPPRSYSVGVWRGDSQETVCVWVCVCVDVGWASRGHFIRGEEEPPRSQHHGHSQLG